VNIDYIWLLPVTNPKTRRKEPAWKKEKDGYKGSSGSARNQQNTEEGRDSRASGVNRALSRVGGKKKDDLESSFGGRRKFNYK